MPIEQSPSSMTIKTQVHVMVLVDSFSQLRQEAAGFDHVKEVGGVG